MEKKPSPGQLKIEEYVDRILKGEDEGTILKDLTPLMASELQRQLEIRRNQQVEKEKSIEEKIPPQYKGMTAEVVDIAWTPSTEEHIKLKKQVLDFLKEKREKEELNILKKEQDDKRIDKIREELGAVDCKLKFNLFKGGVEPTINADLNKFKKAFEEIKRLYKGIGPFTLSNETVDVLVLLGAMTTTKHMVDIFRDKDFQKKIIDDFTLIFGENSNENKENKEFKKPEFDNLSEKDIGEFVESLPKVPVAEGSRFTKINPEILSSKSFSNLNKGDRIYSEGKIGVIKERGRASDVTIKFNDGSEKSIMPAMQDIFLLEDIKLAHESFKN